MMTMGYNNSIMKASNSSHHGASKRVQLRKQTPDVRSNIETPLDSIIL